MKIKRLIDYPDYVVSDCGKVWNSITGNELKGNVSNSGYLYVTVDKSKVYIHRLIALAFCERSSCKYVVDHIDSNKLNNKSCNLRWVTSSENIIKAYECGERQRLLGESASSSKLTKAEVLDIRKLYDAGWKISEIHRQVHCKTTPQNMGDIVKRRTWKHI